MKQRFYFLSKDKDNCVNIMTEYQSLLLVVVSPIKSETVVIILRNEPIK